MRLNILINKLKNTDERSAKVGKNVILTFFFKGGSMLVNLALVPITINFVNPTEYGIWLTLSSIIAWFGVSDIGFGHGLRNKFAEAVAFGNKNLARTYISTTYIALAAIILFVWLVFFIVNNFLDWSVILNTERSLKDELSKVVIIVFTSFSLQFVFKLLGTVLIANQEPGKAAGFDFIANSFILLSIYILMSLNVSGSLTVLAILTGGFQLLVFIIASLWFYNHNLKEYRPSIKYFDYYKIKSLMGLGIQFFVIQIAAIFVFQSTNIIITQILGPEQVTVYNIAYKYFTIPMTIALIVVSPLWSAFTDAYTKKDYEWMKKVNRILNYFVIIIVVMLLLFYILSPIAYKIWIGNEVIIPQEISFFMMLNIIAATFFSCKVVLLNGIGKLKVQLRANLLLSFLYIPITIFLGYQYGLIGVILSNLFINIVYSILIPYILHTEIKKKS